MRLFDQELFKIFSELLSAVAFPSRGTLMSCVRAFEQFDWLAPSDAAEKLKSIRLSSTRVAERLDATIVRNKQSKYNSRSAARGKIRLVENRLYL